MHYSTCAVILAAGSSIATASAGTSAGDLSDSELVRRFLFGNLLPKLPLKRGGPVTPAKAPPSKTPSSPAPAPAKPLSKASPPSTQSNPDDPETAQVRRAARQAAAYMTEYQKVHPPAKGQSLADDMPPPMNFQMSTYTGAVTSNNYQGPVTNNDNRLTATGGSTIANGGSKIDKSMNDNRQQVAPGATLNGNTNGNRNLRRRDGADSYAPKEDGRVVYRDFVLLTRAMRRDPAAKEQVLYEIAGIPGFRELVEGLIASYTETDGQLTMNNFAALVSAMTQDKSVETKSVDAFNSNLVYASVIEKLLTKYYKPEDSDASEDESSKKKKKSSSKKSSSKESSKESSKARRDFDNEHFSLAMRSIDREYLQMQARDILDEYDSWLAARELDDHVMRLLGRDLDAEIYDPELFY